jgi:hypothetical protein
LEITAPTTDKTVKVGLSQLPKLMVDSPIVATPGARSHERRHEQFLSDFAGRLLLWLHAGLAGECRGE